MLQTIPQIIHFWYKLDRAIASFFNSKKVSNPVKIVPFNDESQKRFYFKTPKDISDVKFKYFHIATSLMS